MVRAVKFSPIVFSHSKQDKEFQKYRENKELFFENKKLLKLEATEIEY